MDEISNFEKLIKIAGFTCLKTSKSIFRRKHPHFLLDAPGPLSEDLPSVPKGNELLVWVPACLGSGLTLV